MSEEGECTEMKMRWERTNGAVGSRTENGNRSSKADLAREEHCSKLRGKAAPLRREAIEARMRHALIQTIRFDERNDGAEGKLRETSDVFERTSSSPICLVLHRPIQSEMRRAQALHVRVEQASRDVVWETPAKQYLASK